MPALRAGLSMFAAALISFTGATLSWAQSQTGASPGAGDLQPGNHLVFGATAHTLPAGRGYFQITEFAVPRFDVGITDRITVGAGTLAFYPRVLILTPKVQVYRNGDTAAAIGIIHVAGGSQSGGGVLYAVATKDVGDTSLTAGVGMGYVHYEGKKDEQRARKAVALIGAEFRRSTHNTILLEGYAFGPGGVAVIAGRHTWTRFSLDYGAMFIVAPDFVSPPSPVMNFTWGF